MHLGPSPAGTRALQYARVLSTFCPWPLWCGRPARKEPMRIYQWEQPSSTRSSASLPNNNWSWGRYGQLDRQGRQARQGHRKVLFSAIPFGYLSERLPNSVESQGPLRRSWRAWRPWRWETVGVTKATSWDLNGRRMRSVRAIGIVSQSTNAIQFPSVCSHQLVLYLIIDAPAQRCLVGPIPCSFHGQTSPRGVAVLRMTGICYVRHSSSRRRHAAVSERPSRFFSRGSVRVRPSAR